MVFEEKMILKGRVSASPLFFRVMKENALNYDCEWLLFNPINKRYSGGIRSFLINKHKNEA